MEEHHIVPYSIAKGDSFPVKLHKILSNPLFCRIITWLPHGRSWKILQSEEFEREVLPRYFRHKKLASFMRQVNGWAFTRVNEGPDHKSYYHEVRLCLTLDIMFTYERINLNFFVSNLFRHFFVDFHRFVDKCGAHAANRSDA